MTNRARALKRWIHKEPPYLDDTAERRDFIADTIAQYVSPDDSVLETGFIVDLITGYHLRVFRRRQ